MTTLTPLPTLPLDANLKDVIGVINQISRIRQQDTALFNQVQNTLTPGALTSAVTTFTGDSVVLNNSASTGAVTATLASHARNTVFAGPASGANATPTFRALVAADLPSNGVVSVKRQVFTSNGTYTPSAGMLYCIGEVQGGGGGGGGFANGGATIGGVAGGGGAYANKVISAATIGSSQTITVGGAGGAGASSGAGTGGNGGQSSVGAIVSANGGTGGAGNVSSTTLGGVGSSTTSGADFSVPGKNGAKSTSSSSLGAGGDSYFGRGGQEIIAAATAGNAGVGFGSGGSGGSAGGAAVTGGAGTAGIVVITEFCSQ